MYGLVSVWRLLYFKDKVNLHKSGAQPGHHITCGPAKARALKETAGPKS